MKQNNFEVLLERILSTLSLQADEWANITRSLRSPTANAEAERVQLAMTIATYETVLGRKAGSSQDIGGTLKGVFRLGQLDCIDETMNTETLLVMLSREGLLHWHRRGAGLIGLSF